MTTTFIREPIGGLGICEPQPRCCGVPMLRIPGVSLECSEAYLSLGGAGVLVVEPGTATTRLHPRATAEQIRLHEHLLAQRIPRT